MKSISSLVGSAIVAGVVLSSGCASMPKPVKVIATPVAIVRDVVDVPLATTATFFNYLSDASKDRTGEIESNSGYGWTRSGGQWNSGFGLGASVDITSPVSKLLSRVIGASDYVLCRSFVDSVDGRSSIKGRHESWRDFLFPNMDALWGKQEEVLTTPTTYSPYYNRR